MFDVELVSSKEKLGGVRLQGILRSAKSRQPHQKRAELLDAAPAGVAADTGAGYSWAINVANSDVDVPQVYQRFGKIRLP